MHPPLRTDIRLFPDRKAQDANTHFLLNPLLRFRQVVPVVAHALLRLP